MSYEQVVVFEDRQLASRRYQDRFKMSKKTFKKAIGALYREKLIEIKEDGIYLIKE
jgi:predicted RNA-binding protein (virulence factor B family)